MMPFTVITIKKAPNSLRGDLTRWTQEIATGVYIGNFNVKVREQLWKRVCESIGAGEATLSFSSRNEVGYQFETYRTRQQNIDFEGVPLVMTDSKEISVVDGLKPRHGFSDVSKYHNARKFSAHNRKEKADMQADSSSHDDQMEKKRTYVDGVDAGSFVFLDFETDGLTPEVNRIIEMGAVILEADEERVFHALIAIDHDISKQIETLTGITNSLLNEKGINISDALAQLTNFIGSRTIVGYNVGFDYGFLNAELNRAGQTPMNNALIDLRKLIKREKLFLPNYKFQTVLEAYGISEEVPHRALQDARLTAMLAQKVKGISELG